MLIGAAMLGVGLFRLQYINVVPLLPSSLLLHLQTSRYDWLWQAAAIELDNRHRAGQLSTAEAAQFLSNTFLLEPMAPDEASQGRAFELGLRIIPRTPRLARALQRGRSRMTEVSAYHLEDLSLTLEDGTPLPSDGAAPLVGEALPCCIEIGVSPHTYGWPVVLSYCGRFKLCLSGTLIVGCPLSETPKIIPFSLVHKLEVTEQPASSVVPSASDQGLDARIRSAFESLSWDDDKDCLRLNFGISDTVCELQVSARRPSDRTYVRLSPVLAVGEQTVRLPREWSSDPSWKKAGWVELKATGAWTLPHNTLFRLLSISTGDMRWRYWDSELTQIAPLRNAQHSAPEDAGGRAEP